MMSMSEISACHISLWGCYFHCDKVGIFCGSVSFWPNAFRNYATVILLANMRLMGEITLSVLYVTKLSCYWHDFCDQLSCIYGEHYIVKSTLASLYLQKLSKNNTIFPTAITAGALTSLSVLTNIWSDSMEKEGLVKGWWLPIIDHCFMQFDESI